MLLDDPLSAVDPRVGRILFQECLGPQGIMQVPCPYFSASSDAGLGAALDRVGQAANCMN